VTPKPPIPGFTCVGIVFCLSDVKIWTFSPNLRPPARDLNGGPYRDALGRCNRRRLWKRTQFLPPHSASYIYTAVQNPHIIHLPDANKIKKYPVTQAMTYQHQTNNHYPVYTSIHVLSQSYDKVILDINERSIHNTVVD